jgi:hypothetical protein
MPTDGTGPETEGQPQGHNPGGLLADPRWLAAGAAGLAAAFLSLWAFRGMPLGVIAFWLTPLPLFMAGLGFGTGSAFGATALATLALWVTAAPVGAWLFLLGFGMPAVVLVAASAGGRLDRPLALLGLLPAAGIVAAAIWLSDVPGGLEGTLRAIAQSTLRRFDVPASGGLLADIVRVKAAAIGFWLSLALLGNAWAAARLLARLGVAGPPAWSTARLPGWYMAAPAVALGFWLAADEGADATRLSLLLVLLVPLLLHGLAALHTRTRGLGERPLLLGALYVALVVLFLPASLAVAGYGAFDLLVRRSPSNGGGGRAAPPPGT